HRPPPDPRLPLPRSTPRPRPAGACGGGGGPPPPRRTCLLHLSEDPDRGWAEYGGHLLYEAQRYAAWQSAGARSAVRSAAQDTAALRAEGVYRIVTPDAAVRLAQEDGTQGALILHPLCGGMPVEEGWRSLRLFAERVLPRLTG
ncbi:LLM class flavin-dependent oxidoreductase, partial [Streptomyces sp. NPDC059101]